MLVRMQNITKTYGPLVANDNVSISLSKGEILAIVGENGAGKSTIMKVLYGLESYDSGEILINDQPVRFRSSADAIAHGIGMVQQHFMLFGPYTAAENIVYGHEPRKGIFMDRKKTVSDVEELCSKYGLHIDPNAKVQDCPVGIQQRIEILKVLYQGVDILIFDEPSAVLTPQEIDELLETIKALKASGKSIILITHKLNEVMAVADRVTVMRHGKVVKEMRKEDTSVEELSFLMVGHHIRTMTIDEVKDGGECLSVNGLVLKGLGDKNIIDGLDLHVNHGEIVGIAGVSGNGQSELVLCLTGVRKFQGGSVTIDGNDISGLDPCQVRQAGVSCIPEDRFLWGSAVEGSLSENCIMAHHTKPEFCNKGVFKMKEIESFSERIMNDFDVRHVSQTQLMGELSGGNAQKLIVAREFSQKAPLLIAAEPTRGIDIGAIEYIHGKLVEKRDQGDAILLISSELSEIMELSDRIYVIYDGKIAGEFTRQEATPEKIGYLMMGGRDNG